MVIAWDCETSGYHQRCMGPHLCVVLVLNALGILRPRLLNLHQPLDVLPGVADLPRIQLFSGSSASECPPSISMCLAGL